jgi:hypothetical protein
VTSQIGDGFSISVPIRIPSGSAVHTALKFMMPDGAGFEFTLGFEIDFASKEGAASIAFSDQEWTNLGAIEKMVLSLSFRVEFVAAKVKAASIEVTLDMNIRVNKEDGEFFHFRGTIGAEPTRIHGSIDLISPSVIRFISPRIALVSLSSQPLSLGMDYNTVGQLLGMDMAANVILQSDRSITPAFSLVPTKGDDLWSACRSDSESITVEFKLGITYHPPTQVVAVKRLQFRMTGEATIPKLIQAATGQNLGSGVKGIMGKTLGTINLFAFDYSLEAASVKSSGAFSVIGIAAMFDFSMNWAVTPISS